MGRVGVAYNWGYRLSRASTLNAVDKEFLAQELGVRGITCEVPICEEVAYTILPSGVTALACESHTRAYESSRVVAEAIETAIKFTWQAEMAAVTNAAYEDADDHVTYVNSTGTDLLEKARRAYNDIDRLIELENRRIEAAKYNVTQAAKVEPVVATGPTLLSSLPSGNLLPPINLFG